MPESAVPLRVGYVLRKFPVLSETFILNEILALEALGIQITVFVLTRPSIPRFHEDLPKLKATIFYIPEIDDLKMLFRYRKRAARHYGKNYRRTLAYTLKRANPALLWRLLQSCYVAEKAVHLQLNHLHAHFATRATTVAFLASMMTGIPYSFTAHAFDIFSEEVSRKALVKKIEHARFVITVSEFNKKFLEGLMPAGYGRIIRIYNGIELARFSPNGSVPPSMFTLLCVARLVEKKGHTDLVEACRLLRDRGHEFRAWIIGTGHLRADLERQIKQHHLNDFVFLLGPHTQLEVVNRYRSSHLFVLPCRIDSEGNRDGLPVALVEALACGVPVVTTPMTGIPEVIRDVSNGLLVPQNNPMALADAIASVMKDAHLYESLRANARASVEANFDIRQTAAAIKTLLETGGGPR